MKQIILALALLAGAAHADVIFTTPNKAGGFIALTDIKCDAGGLVVYSTQAGSNTSQLGCWTADNLNVIIRWATGEAGVFPMTGWTMVGKKGASL